MSSHAICLRAHGWGLQSGFQLDRSQVCQAPDANVILEVKLLSQIKCNEPLVWTELFVQNSSHICVDYPASRHGMTATDVAVADVPKCWTKLTETATKLGRKCKNVQTFVHVIFMSFTDHASFWILTNQRRLRISGCHPMADIEWRP